MEDQLAYKINFAKLRDFIRNPTITSTEKCVLLDLILYAGVDGIAFPSETKIGQDFNIGDRQVRNIITRLKKVGAVVGWKRRGYSGSNSYTINPELYFRNDISYRKSTSSHSGTVIPLHSGNILPPKVSHEISQLSSSTLQLFKKTFKKDLNKEEFNRLKHLCTDYSEDWVQGAINDLVSRDPTLPFITLGLVSKKLSDWKETGKPQPKPIFKPCGKHGCKDGSIFNSDHQTFSLCDCKVGYEKAKVEWGKDWG